MSEYFVEDELITKFESPLEAFSRVHGTSDRRLELFLNAETSAIYESKDVIRYFSTRSSIIRCVFKELENLFKCVEVKPRLFEPIISTNYFLSAKTIFSPERRTFSINPEVREILEKDELSRTILDNVLLEIQEILELRDEDYTINISLVQDIEVPEWKEILFSVQVENRNYDDKMRLWEEIEEGVRTKIEQIREKYPEDEWKIIDKINENLAIEVVEIQL
ncbi:MAG: hypothetical protein ACUVXA_20015 [Candidatus Jordarchaeum sp.]|uniref:hypothetical protein n=1 Tax=Candidatus Jordarchaeum sp. TaxID=2823881 RepID=UPI004049CC51